MKQNRTISSRDIIYLSFTITLLGLILLVYATNTFTPEITQIKYIDESFQGKYVFICGTVKNIKTIGQNTIITLESENVQINSIFFDTKQNIKLNNNICIKGRLEIYKNTIEILGDKITE
ncbi:MAG: hypothetical protein K0B07_01555 [DPANN group archaeon]|nr:hypothetical protein [DPANN group archaeon]